jgi:glycosyltransferase involved in cell wall biosynthesis
VKRDLSVIVPVYNEEENILPLVREIAQAFAGSGLDYEIVFVDDASTDGTAGRIAEACAAEPRVRAQRHRRNAGQSAALWTGIQATESPLIATLDGDLQNDPADLPRLLEFLPEHDFVCGYRAQRRDNWLRRVSSRAARQARKRVLGVDFRDTGCALRVFKRSALREIFPFNGLHRFLPVLVHAAGGRTKEVPINHRPRVAGVSKYGLWNRLGRGIFDLLAMAWYQKRRIGPIPCEEIPGGAAYGLAAAAGTPYASALT